MNTELQIVAANVPAPVIVLADAVAHLLLERFSSSPAPVVQRRAPLLVLPSGELQEEVLYKK